jgi:hypothetical protein
MFDLRLTPGPGNVPRRHGAAIDACPGRWCSGRQPNTLDEAVGNPVISGSCWKHRTYTNRALCPGPVRLPLPCRHVMPAAFDFLLDSSVDMHASLVPSAGPNARPEALKAQQASSWHCHTQHLYRHSLCPQYIYGIRLTS